MINYWDVHMFNPKQHRTLSFLKFLSPVPLNSCNRFSVLKACKCSPQRPPAWGWEQQSRQKTRKCRNEAYCVGFVTPFCLLPGWKAFCLFVCWMNAYSPWGVLIPYHFIYPAFSSIPKEFCMQFPLGLICSLWVSISFPAAVLHCL